jgi:hypothetical protein
MGCRYCSKDVKVLLLHWKSGHKIDFYLGAWLLLRHPRVAKFSTPVDERKHGGAWELTLRHWVTGDVNRRGGRRYRPTEGFARFGTEELLMSYYVSTESLIFLSVQRKDFWRRGRGAGGGVSMGVVFWLLKLGQQQWSSVSLEDMKEMHYTRSSFDDEDVCGRKLHFTKAATDVRVNALPQDRSFSLALPISTSSVLSFGISA